MFGTPNTKPAKPAAGAGNRVRWRWCGKIAGMKN
jgi:hypothetical protein